MISFDAEEVDDLLSSVAGSVAPTPREVDGHRAPQEAWDIASPIVKEEAGQQDVTSSASRHGNDPPRPRACELEDCPATDGDLQRAALDGDAELVRCLIEKGASVNAPMRRASDPDGDVFVTLLHVLSSEPQLANGAEVMSEIMKRKANPNSRSTLGITPLARACLHKHLQAAEILLSNGAIADPVDDKGRNATCCAVLLEIDTNATSASRVETVSAELVSLLASKGADLDAGGEVAPLLEAIRQTNRPAVTCLLSHGAKPRFLHVAVEQAQANIIEDLLKGQANPLEEDSEGKTVLDVAFRRGDEEITTLLRDFIGDLERRNLASGQAQRASGIIAHRESNTTEETNKTAIHSETPSGEEEEATLGLSLETQRGLRRKKDGEAMAHVNSRASRRFSLTGTALLQRRSMFAAAKESKRATFHNYERLKFLKEPWHKIQQYSRRLNRSRNFQLVMFAALLLVLFLPDLWVISDVENNDGLDAVLVIILILFFLELVVQTIASPRTYVNSFFFWTDVVGLCSVPLDHSMVSDSLPRSFDNAVVMRAARTARLGARAGRFTKLVKLLRFMPGVQQDTGTSRGTAKTMSNALMLSLSTRVSCLIIVMVMVLPLFEMATYPENDFSMKTWMNSLDFTLERFPTDLKRRITEFESFYVNKDYYPYEVQWEGSNGTEQMRLAGRRPRRQSNEQIVKADSDLFFATFNFDKRYQVDAMCNMILIALVIALMMGFSLLLSNSVSAIVLQPLENLLTGVKQMASKIFKSVVTMAAQCAKTGEKDLVDDEDNSMGANETELLEKVIEKLAALSAITMKTSPIDAETLEQLGESDRAVLQGFHADQLPMIKISGRSTGKSPEDVLDAEMTEDHTAELVLTLERHLEEAGVAWGSVDSWEFNVVDIEETQRHMVCLCFLIFHLGASYTSNQQPCLASFIEAAACGYSNPTKVPYHNWYHAVDVTHCIFRLLNLCSSELFLSHYERFALVVSAVCHDIGHPGLNNPFLVETSQELAIRYNDHSPLENMHCAKLFEIVRQPKTAVFANLDRQQYREVRQVCIEAILHTDNIHHFTMVKELQMLYEMNSDMFDIALQMYQTEAIDYPPKEICDMFVETDKRKLLRNLLLHFSDISNPTKPFDICQKWAWFIVDEFFNQGDKEKELGITVQPLNDRDKVNRPYSQVGFIEFFVAPFAFATVRLLPPLAPLTDQMMLNLNSWMEEWVNTTTPSPPAEEVAKLQERVAKLEAKFVFREGF